MATSSRVRAASCTSRTTAQLDALTRRTQDINTFRGADWRGRDCDDLSNQIYPGRRNTTFPPAIDHNCNGIKGADRHGNSYESVRTTSHSLSVSINRPMLLPE